MKVYHVLLLGLFLFGQSLFGQEKDWKKITDLLQSEAQYFTGKNGYIKLGKSEYNIFSIEKFSVSDSLINFKMRLQDRFGNEDLEQILDEIIVLHPDLKINSAEIAYDYSFYFEDFPQSQFLMLEFEDNFPMIHQINSTYKNLKTGKEDQSVMEETTYQIYFPIRSKNREKIFKAIDHYQNQTIKTELQNDKNH